MRKSRKRKRLAPGLRGLRRWLPGRRRRAPVVVSAPVPEPVAVLPEVRPRTRVEPPTQVDYGLDIQRLGDAILTLGDRLDVQARKVLPVQVDHDPDIQRLGDAVLALGNRVDAQARKVPPAQVDYGPDVQRLEDVVLALGDRVDQVARRGG